MNVPRIHRIWLLVLLAVLLPIRGAMAGAMLCPPVADSHEHHHHDAQQASDERAHNHHHDGALQQDKCSLCASCCAAVPLASALPSVPESHDTTQFLPSPNAPAPTFLSSGPERPPRSI